LKCNITASPTSDPPSSIVVGVMGHSGLSVLIKVALY
jgi:hypothetical protein